MPAPRGHGLWQAGVAALGLGGAEGISLNSALVKTGGCQPLVAMVGWHHGVAAIGVVAQCELVWAVPLCKPGGHQPQGAMGCGRLGWLLCVGGGWVLALTGVRAGTWTPKAWQIVCHNPLGTVSFVVGGRCRSKWECATYFTYFT